MAGQESKSGKLLELNGHNGFTGILWEPDGTKWLCRFQKDQVDRLPEAWLRTVTLTGEAIVEEGKEHIMKVSSIRILDEVGGSSFWRSLSLDELAAQQGVSPVFDLDKVGALWPTGDDPDRFMAFVTSERAARRRAANEGGSR